MSGSRRLLIVGGIALALWGMGYGLWYAVLAEHQALNKIGGSLATAFDAAARPCAASSTATIARFMTIRRSIEGARSSSARHAPSAASPSSSDG